MQSYGRMKAAKNAAKTVLATLNPSDSFNVVDFDGDARTISTTSEYDSCFSSQLVNATPANLNRLKDWISNLRDTGMTNFIAAFNTAFDILASSFATNPELKKRPTVFLFLTDGDAADPIATINRRKEELALEKFHIFTFALGSGVSEKSQRILEGISASTDGNFIKISDNSQSELRSSMASYYSHPGLMKTADESGIILTVPYVDASGLGMVTTLARQS